MDKETSQHSLFHGCKVTLTLRGRAVESVSECFYEMVGLIFK